MTKHFTTNGQICRIVATFDRRLTDSLTLYINGIVTHRIQSLKLTDCSGEEVADMVAKLIAIAAKESMKPACANPTTAKLIELGFA